MGKKSRSRIRIRDEYPESYFLELKKQFFGLKILKFLDADPGWKNLDPGSGINIPDPQHCFNAISSLSLVMSPLRHVKKMLLKEESYDFARGLKKSSDESFR
jgi:hypothetical protein